MRRNLSPIGFACCLALCACGHQSHRPVAESNNPLTAAAEKGDVVEVTRLLGGREHVNDADENGYTALHRASHCGDVRVVKSLIAAGANVNAKTKQNVTPLLVSIDMACPLPEVTMALIEAGADVNVAEEGGDTAIVIASTESSVEVMKELLRRGANTDARGLGGETALHYAAMNNLLDRTQILLQAGARTDIKNDAGLTPLDVAMPETKKLIVEFIRTHYGDLGKSPKLEGPFQLAQGETYKGAPIIKYSIRSDGTVFDVRLIRSSGMKALDDNLVRTYSAWKFNAQVGRPVIETETSVTVDWQ